MGKAWHLQTILPNGKKKKKIEEFPHFAKRKEKRADVALSNMVSGYGGGGLTVGLNGLSQF